ncbi:Mycolic acid cyclopropane synthase [Artemisia annua]|uniref:Mycolic acid cyclopropane synthase n=1 Tax=Artemisia annua TaxID=35608 RepID=A0A2U1KUJ2_ARTAN|nr:Mycolic acid cyclopropane synthase [Artemisia annua]
MTSSKMRVAVVGAGISGLVSAYVLAKAGVDVVLYEKEDYLGGHAKTVTMDDGVDLDLGFMVFNRVTYPNMMELFETLGVDIEHSDMSFSVSLDEGNGCEWGGRNGLSSLFAQKSNALNPKFWQMIREITKFKHDVLRYLEEVEHKQDITHDQTLGDFIKSHGYSELFQKAYIVPICSSVWSCPADEVMSFSAFSILSFCRNHHVLQLFGRPQWFTVRSRSRTYVKKVKEELENRGCQIRTGCAVRSVSKRDGCLVMCEDGYEERYSGCIIATHAPDTLKMLGEQATYDERRILGSFSYVYSDIFLHRDKSLMPKNSSAWSAWNFLGTADNRACLTYWLNVLQNIDDKGLPYLVTLNPPRTPEKMLLKWTTGHPIPSVAATKASLELHRIQGKRGIWFCGAYQGYGFHEDGLKAGIVAANGMLSKSCEILNNPKHMVPSLIENGARIYFARFLQDYVVAGTLIILEEGGTMFRFEGTSKKSCLKAYVKVHNPQFYWKIITNGDLGFADAYINGDFSLIDKQRGLLDMFMVRFVGIDLVPQFSCFPTEIFRVCRFSLLIVLYKVLRQGLESVANPLQTVIRNGFATDSYRSVNAPWKFKLKRISYGEKKVAMVFQPRKIRCKLATVFATGHILMVYQRFCYNIYYKEIAMDKSWYEIATASSRIGFCNGKQL